LQIITRDIRHICGQDHNAADIIGQGAYARLDAMRHAFGLINDHNMRTVRHDGSARMIGRGQGDVTRPNAKRAVAQHLKDRGARNGFEQFVTRAHTR
jgi:hypothetical protein